MRRNITENKITKIVQESIRKVLSEANNNLQYRDFLNDMRDMGFEPREANGSSKVFHNPEYHCDVTLHIHNDGERVQADSLREVKKVLQQVGWFNNPDNRKKFPFDKWGFKHNTVDYDDSTEIEMQEIENANEEYKNAIVYSIYPIKDSVCALKTSDGINLCRSTNDRRPLLDRWFDKIIYKGEKCYLEFENYDTIESELYEVYTDGTINIKPIIYENKAYGKFSKKMGRRK